MRLPGSKALSGFKEGGSPVDIVTVPELIEHPDVGGGGVVDPLASQPIVNIGEPRELQNDRRGRRDDMDTPPDIRTGGTELP